MQATRQEFRVRRRNRTNRHLIGALCEKAKGHLITKTNATCPPTAFHTNFLSSNTFSAASQNSFPVPLPINSTQAYHLSSTQQRPTSSEIDFHSEPPPGTTLHRRSESSYRKPVTRSNIHSSTHRSEIDWRRWRRSWAEATVAWAGSSRWSSGFSKCRSAPDTGRPLQW